MERDIRLYYYQNSVLKTPSKRKGQHLFDALVDCYRYIEFRKSRGDTWQWVITEYFGVYDSKIIEVI